MQARLFELLTGRLAFLAMLLVHRPLAAVALRNLIFTERCQNRTESNRTGSSQDYESQRTNYMRS